MLGLPIVLRLIKGKCNKSGLKVKTCKYVTASMSLSYSPDGINVYGTKGGDFGGAGSV